MDNLVSLCPNCHARADRGDYSQDHLKDIKEAKIRKLGIRKAFENVTEPRIAFKTLFASKLDRCIILIEKGKYGQQLYDSIDELIMLIKEKIEKWDTPSIRFGTEELFLKLYKHVGKIGLNLYNIYKDLFKYAYSQRKHFLGVMIQVFHFVLFKSWVPEYDVERGERACEILLRLGLDFLNQDLAITKDCFISIDNLAGDMFEPEILSKEIILGAHVYEEKSKNTIIEDLLEQIVEYIQINDQYSWDAGIKTYLKDSIQYAEWEQEKYEVNIEPFKNRHLLPALEGNVDMEIKGYVQFLGDLMSEGADGIEDTFPAEELAKMILAYEFLRPKFAEELEEQIIKTNNRYIIEMFKRIVNDSSFLRKIYGRSEMITTFDELIRFLETSSDMENLGVGVTTHSLAMVDFERKLKEDERDHFEKIAEKYGIQENFEVTDRGINFEMDRLVYSGKDEYSMRRLIDFLKEINSKLGVKSFSTGITFGLRELERNSKS